MTPEIQYAKSGDVHIAQQTFEQGAENIVIIPGFVSYREHLPSFRFRSSGGAGPSVGGMQTRACPLRQLREAAEGRFRIYRVRRMPRLRVGSCDRRHNLPFEYPLFFGRRVTNGLPCVASRRRAVARWLSLLPGRINIGSLRVIAISWPGASRPGRAALG